MASPAANILPLSGDELIDAMTTGYRWTASEPIYYSFSNGLNGETWAQPGFVSGRLAAIFAAIDPYVAVDFVFAGQFASPTNAALAGSDINFALDDVFISGELDDNVLAIGLFPNVAFAQSAFGPNYYSGAEGDIFINANSVANSYGFQPGEAGFSLALHEVGHALGLKHPHDDGATSHPTFEQSGIGGLDIDWMTVMSYDDDFNWNLNAWDPATPMILDVIALQYLYGVDTATNAGDDTYTLQASTGLYTTIFDASGSDTLDLSGYQDRAYVDLPKYIISDEQYAPFGLVTTLDDRDAIGAGGSPHTLDWLLGDIETVIGSPFGDLIAGTSRAETLIAGGGPDDIFVGAGDDIVDGGDGIDWVYFEAAFADSVITPDGDGWIVESAADGRNALRNVETLVFDYAGEADIRDVESLGQPATAAGAADDWILLAGDGQLFGVGGAGAVVGTADFQHLFVLAFTGTMELDSSFNRGGDVVSVAGDAGEWSVALSGSDALLLKGQSEIAIPVGPAGLLVEFDDGIRTLRYDQAAGQAMIGSQALDGEFAPISAPAEAIDPSGDPVADQFGRLLFTGGAEVTIAGNFEIYGTSGREQVNLAYGNFQLDPSFNRGGDLVAIQEDIGAVSASLQESRVLLESETVVASLPVGDSGLQIAFFDTVRTLIYNHDEGAVFLGAQQIGFDPAVLTFA